MRGGYQRKMLQRQEEVEVLEDRSVEDASCLASWWRRSLMRTD